MGQYGYLRNLMWYSYNFMQYQNKLYQYSST